MAWGVYDYPEPPAVTLEERYLRRSRDYDPMDKYAEYERMKELLQGLPPREYEKRLREIAGELGI
jgi:hypothetical protein